jgi:hypothetical protein
LHDAYTGLTSHHQDWPTGISENTLVPPDVLTPVLLARSDGQGILTWLQLELLALSTAPVPASDDPATTAALAGATAVGSWFQDGTGAPCVPVLTGDIAAAGTSAAGPVYWLLCAPWLIFPAQVVRTLVPRVGKMPPEMLPERTEN